MSNFRNFFRYFNVKAISEESSIHYLRVHKSFNKRPCKEFTEEEKDSFIGVLKKPVIEMFDRFGYHVTIRKKGEGLQ